MTLTLLETLQVITYCLLICIIIAFLLDKAIGSISRRKGQLNDLWESIDNVSGDLHKLKKELFLPSIINKQLRSLQVDNRLRTAEKKLGEYFDMSYKSTAEQNLKIDSMNETLESFINRNEQRWLEYNNLSVNSNAELQRIITDCLKQIQYLKEKLPL